MASGYREIYKYYLMLQKGLSINSNIFSLSMKELSLLYEYWCFIKINSLLRKRYKIETSKEYQKSYGGIGPKEEDINTMHSKLNPWTDMSGVFTF